MTRLVVDASAALAWLVRSQATPASDALLAKLDLHELIAPFVFEWEVGNFLMTHLRSGRLQERAYANAADTLTEIGVRVGAPFRVDVVESLARRSQLSLFDAAYLRLALEEQCTLVSRDNALLTAAQTFEVSIVDLRPAAS